MSLYPKDVKKNIAFRLNLLIKAKTDKKLRAIIAEKCEKDILFFVNTLCWTYDPRLEDPHLPFITYPFQDEHLIDLVEAIEQGEDYIFDKSRDMGASWLAVILQSWGFLFRKWGQLYGSYKEAYVDRRGDMDSNFEKIRYLFNRLPAWLKPADIIDKHMSISSKELGCNLAGDVGENFGTGGRRKVVYLDEFSYWNADKNAFRKTRDITNCRIFWGTPTGRWNIFGKIMTGDQKYKHIKIKKKSLLWNLHPNKTPEWHEEEKKRRTAIDMAREIDLSYDDSVEGAVYKDFVSIARIEKCKLNPKLALYTSWDFGRDMTAILWKQKDFDTGLVYTIKAYQKTDKDIDFFAAFITGEPTQGFTYTEEELEMIREHRSWKHLYANHYGDPYNAHSRSVISENTIVKQLAVYGIHIQTRTGTTVAERIMKTTLAMKRMVVDEDQGDYIQAMIQSRYPEIKERSQATTEKTIPVHDIYSHYRTAEEYWNDNEPEGIRKETDTQAARAFYQ